jgi:hypothetical protein
VQRALLFWIVAFSGASAAAEPPNAETWPRDDDILEEQQFLREYAWGIHRHPMPGGRVYGWRLGRSLAVGRIKGERDGFGFSYELTERDRVEITTEAIRWRRAIGKPRR